jgi:hypothetical protein
MRRILFPLVALTLLAALPCPAETRLGLGADYVTDNQGLFLLTLGVDTPLAHELSVGGRFGAFLVSGPHFGAPIDLSLRFHPGRIYLEGLVGPWLFFSDGDSVRLHGGIGFGLYTRGLSFGLEVGGLSGGVGLFGVRLAFPI